MAQPNAGGQGTPPLIRPAQIEALPFFSAEQKTHYKGGLTKLWTSLETATPGSPQYVELELKIRQASMAIMQQMNNKGRPASGGGAPGLRPGAQQGGLGPGMPQGGSQQAQQAQQAPQLQQVQEAQGQPASAGLALNQQQPGGMTQQAAQELRNVKINIPLNVLQAGEAEVQSYKSQWFRKGHSLLQKRDQAKMQGQFVQRQMQAGQGNAQQMQQLQKCKADMEAAVREWEQLKRVNASYGQQQQQGDVKINVDQQTSLSPQQQQSSLALQHAQQGQPQLNVTQQPTSQAARQTPQSATQPQAAQNFPSQQNNLSQQQRAQQMAQAQQAMAQQQQPQPPQQAQSAQQAQQTQQTQRPQPLTHQAAISQAAESYSRAQSQGTVPQQQQQQPQVPQVPNGIPFNNPPSATQTTPTSAYPPLSSSNQLSGAPNNMKTPRALSLDPRTQMPVPGPPSRPTFSNAGMMTQPGIQRPAQFTLEGEGDRVLSKRKLDELVRQVTGSTSDENALSPEVEEAVLTLADDFVDNVITAACRLAKLRSGQTLDIRDVQIALERNYGIRIPGYGLDEVRTVRKFQPAQGWQSKMQAVQAGKVMGGVSKDS